VLLNGHPATQVFGFLVESVERGKGLAEDAKPQDLVLYLRGCLNKQRDAVA